jgi:hypothetical protein
MYRFNEYIIKYEKPIKQLFNSCYDANTIIIGDNVVSYFPVSVYNGIEDLAETIMNPTNCRSTKVTVALKDNPDFATSEPVNFYAGIIKPNLLSDSYVRHLTTLYFPPGTAYNRFNNPLYRHIDQSL